MAALPHYLAPQPYNLIADVDSYKLGQWRMLRVGTTNVYSYIESRGGRYPKVVFAGLQRLLYEKLGQPITREMVEEMAAFVPAHGLSFNRAGWERILEVHGGKLPILIRAVPEGTLVPVHNVLFTIENMDAELPWLTSYLETMILRDLWTACTIATRIFYMAGRIDAHWTQYSDTPMSPFALLDFSSRGVMGYDHSILGGLGYLFCFAGSDNVPAVRAANYYYFSDMSGWSVAATEHTISCSFGRDNDDDYIRNSIENGVDEGSILSLVGDTWDIYAFTQKLVLHKDLIANKKIKIVCRPDSGELRIVLPDVFRIMAAGFGVSANSKGMDVINMEAKVLQGDGMNETTHMLPFEIARDLRIAPDSVITAAGGGLMTADLDRDTNRWAMKASSMIIDGEEIDICKDPITDSGKRSKSGRFALTRDHSGHYHTNSTSPEWSFPDDLLVERFVYGDVYNSETLDQIRARVALQLKERT
jgi:nicotinamide phosphoribosyltransferase